MIFLNIEIIELTENNLEKYDIESFLFNMIKECYNLDYVPEFHKDVKNLSEYYIQPEKNNFFFAIDSDNDKIVGTCGIRGYDKNYDIKDREYNFINTASIWRLLVASDYRHNGIATKLINQTENFCKDKYNEIYLHTQKDSYGALAFWSSRDYQIVEETNDEYGTIHLEKIL